MKLPALALLALATPAGADTFAERWPQTAAVDPAPLVAPSKDTRKILHRAHAGKFVCHQQTYYRGRHRYWRCQR